MQDNPQAKDIKIKSLLTDKFSKKYKVPNNNNYLNIVIDRFVKNGEISTENLKLLDSLLKQEINKTQLKPTRTQSMGNIEGIKRLPNLVNDNKSVKSIMSGISKLSRFSNTNKVKINVKEMKDFYDIDKISVSSTSKSRKAPLSRASGDSDEDWQKIIKYNNKVFKENKERDLEKDQLLKIRTKNDLDYQVIDKFNQVELEKKREEDYANVTMRHTQLLNELENQKMLAQRQKCIEDKEKRDKQLRDNRILRKKEKALELRKDQETIQTIIRENERVKKIAHDKKQREKEALLKIMEENGKYKIIQKELHEKMLEEDRNFNDESRRLQEQLDKERIEYNRIRQRKANSIDPTMIMLKKKEIADKLAEDEMVLNKYKEELDKR